MLRVLSALLILSFVPSAFATILLDGTYKCQEAGVEVGIISLSNLGDGQIEVNSESLAERFSSSIVSRIECGADSSAVQSICDLQTVRIKGEGDGVCSRLAFSQTGAKTLTIKYRRTEQVIGMLWLPVTSFKLDCQSLR